MIDQKALILKFVESIRRNSDKPEKVFSLAEELQGRLLVVPNEGTVPDISSQVEDALTELEEDIQHKGKKGRVPTGLMDVDKLLTISPSDFVVISAESSMGKTALAMNIVEHNALDLNLPSLVFSIEMPAKQLIFRMMASRAKVDIRETTQLGDQSKVKRLIEAAGVIRKAPIYIEDNPDLTDLTIRSKARKMVQDKGIKLIVIDYMQIVSSNGERDGTEAQELSERAMSFKRMARELNVPVIALSQVEEVSGKLYGSRAPRHHADTAIKIMPGDPTMIHIDKQRNGRRDVNIPVSFIPQWTRFENHADEL